MEECQRDVEQEEKEQERENKEQQDQETQQLQKTKRRSQRNRRKKSVGTQKYHDVTTEAGKVGKKEGGNDQENQEVQKSSSKES